LKFKKEARKGLFLFSAVSVSYLFLNITTLRHATTIAVIQASNHSMPALDLFAELTTLKG